MLICSEYSTGGNFINHVQLPGMFAGQQDLYLDN